MARYRPDAFSSCRPWQDIDPVRSQAAGHGKVSPRCVPVLPAVARYRPDVFPKGPRTGKTPVRGNISPPCIQIQLILARYARHASEKPRRAPLGNAPREHLAAKGRFRRPKPSDHARRTNLAALRWPCPRRRGSCPSSCIAGSPFTGLALAQGCLPPAPRRYPPTCQCLPLAVPIAARGKPPMSFGGDHPAHGLQFGQAPRDRRPHHLDGQADNGVLRRTGPGFQNREQVGAEPQAEAAGPAGPASALPKRPSKGRVPLGGTIGTPHPFPIAQKSRPQELTPGSALSAFLAAYSPSEFQAVLRSAPFRLDAVRFSGLPRLLSSDSVHRNYQLRRCEEPPFAGLLRRQEGLP